MASNSRPYSNKRLKT